MLSDITDYVCKHNQLCSSVMLQVWSGFIFKKKKEYYHCFESNKVFLFKIYFSSFLFSQTKQSYNFISTLFLLIQTYSISYLLLSFLFFLFHTVTSSPSTKQGLMSKSHTKRVSIWGQNKMQFFFVHITNCYTVFCTHKAVQHIIVIHLLLFA